MAQGDRGATLPRHDEFWVGDLRERLPTSSIGIEVSEHARRVTGPIRSYDLIIHLGGDEFLCAMSNTSLPDARERFARTPERSPPHRTPAQYEPASRNCAATMTAPTS